MLNEFESKRLITDGGSFIRAHGRPPILKIRGKPFLFMDSEGHVLSLIKTIAGNIHLVCPLCRIKLLGCPKGETKTVKFALETIDGSVDVPKEDCSVTGLKNSNVSPYTMIRPIKQEIPTTVKIKKPSFHVDEVLP